MSVGDIRGSYRYPLRNVRIGGEVYGEVQGAALPGPIWVSSMEQALRDVSPTAFTSPDMERFGGGYTPGLAEAEAAAARKKAEARRAAKRRAAERRDAESRAAGGPWPWEHDTTSVRPAPEPAPTVAPEPRPERRDQGGRHRGRHHRGRR